MKYHLEELKTIMKDNGIKGSYMMLKGEIIDLLKEKQLLPPDSNLFHLPKKETGRKGSRNSQRRVTVEDVKTGEITTYPSLYRAGRTLHKNPGCIVFFNGKIMEGRYKITLSDPVKDWKN